MLDIYTRVKLTRDIGAYKKGDKALIIDVYHNPQAYNLDMYDVKAPLYFVKPKDVAIIPQVRSTRMVWGCCGLIVALILTWWAVNTLRHDPAHQNIPVLIPAQ